MKSADAKRASILVAALTDFPGARRDIKREKPRGTAHKRTVQIAFGDSGGYLDRPEKSYWIDFDALTMRLILDAAEKIVRDELTKMGVEIDQ